MTVVTVKLSPNVAKLQNRHPVMPVEEAFEVYRSEKPDLEIEKKMRLLHQIMSFLHHRCYIMYVYGCKYIIIASFSRNVFIFVVYTCMLYQAGWMSSSSVKIA